MRISFYRVLAVGRRLTRNHENRVVFALSTLMLAMEIDSINCLFRVVWDDMKAELKARDLDEIAALVNAEY